MLRWSPHSGKCVAVDTSETLLGSRLYLWDCLEDFPHELFLLPPVGLPGPIRWAADPSKCIDVQDGSQANGTLLQLWTCFKGNKNQEFVVPTGGGPIRWSKHVERCFSVLGGTPDNGNAIGLWQCSTWLTAPDLSFSVEPAASGCATPLLPRCPRLGEAVGKHEEVAAASADLSAGAPIRLVATSEKCMTVQGASDPNVSSVEVWNCTEGRASQLFLIPASGTGQVRWAAQPDRCLEVLTDPLGRGVGAPLRLGSCRELEPGQVFAIADFPGPMRWAPRKGLCVSLRLGSACEGNSFVLRNCGHGTGPGLKFDVQISSVSLPPELRSGHARGDVLYTNSEAAVPFRPEVGNGFVATVVGSDAVYAAGVFNGCMKDAAGQKCDVSPSRRARISAPLALSLDAKPVGAALDLRGAAYLRYYEGGLRLRFYAHRARRALLVVELSASAEEDEGAEADANSTGDEDANETPAAQSIVVKGGGGEDPASDDFSWTVTKRTVAGREVLVWSGQVKESELPTTPTKVVVVFPAKPAGEAVVEKGSSVTYVAAVRTSLESVDPEESALKDWQAAAAMDAAELYEEHAAAWAELWQSGFEVTGRMDVARSVNASLYYILSSLRQDSAFSLSPGGLASNAYLGHTFWDTEMWMLPPLTLWHPHLSASLLEYRLLRVEQARVKARGYGRNYSGAMYAWESAATGAEECPTWADTGQLEQHITADLAFAQEQLWHATHNVSQLRSAYRALLAETADFWTSRVEWDGGVAHIRKVIPPDEYHTGNDSVFTNFAAQRNLRFATEAASRLGEQPKPEWQRTAEKIPILFDEELGIHPEYDGYAGKEIKQADVILLGFPLMMNMSKATRRADLEYYAKRTAQGGPAMTWGMHAIGRMELGDLVNASADFNRAFANAQRPFYVWTETPTGGAVNFITGAGGFLQAIVYGLPGLRIRPDRLELNPSLLEGMTSVVLRGLHYRGSVFRLSYDEKTMTIACEAGPPILVRGAGAMEVRLPPGGSVSVPRGAATVRPSGGE